MKKLLFLLLIPLFFLSCDKDDSKGYTVMVNVSDEYGLAYPSLVRLYNYDEAIVAVQNHINKNDAYNYGTYRKLKDSNGNEITPIYTSDEFSGVNIVENVKAGKYLIVIMYKPSGYTFENFWFYGYKAIEVNKNNNLALYTCKFPNRARGKFYNF